MKELARNEAIGQINLCPGDTLVAQVIGPDGVSHVVGRYPIVKKMVVDTVIIVAPEVGEFGLQDGIGAIFGTKLKPTLKKAIKNWIDFPFEH